MVYRLKMSLIEVLLPLRYRLSFNTARLNSEFARGKPLLSEQLIVTSHSSPGLYSFLSVLIDMFKFSWEIILTEQELSRKVSEFSASNT